MVILAILVLVCVIVGNGVVESALLHEATGTKSNPDPQKEKFPWWIILIIVTVIIGTVLAIIGCFLLCHHYQKVKKKTFNIIPRIIKEEINSNPIFSQSLEYHYVSHVPAVDVHVKIAQGIKPFHVLGLPKDSEADGIKEMYLAAVQTTDRQQRAVASLAYAMAMSYAQSGRGRGRPPSYFCLLDPAIPMYGFDIASPVVLAIAGDCEHLRALLRDRLSAKNAESVRCESLLYLATRGNMADVAELLVDAGARVNYCPNGSSTLDVATYYGHPALAAYLVARGADTAQLRAWSTPGAVHRMMEMRASIAKVSQRRLPTILRRLLRETEVGMGEVQNLVHGDRVVGYRLAKKLDTQASMLFKYFCYPTWHGTRTADLLSILQDGLRRRPGEPWEPGEQHHVADWGDAIFVSRAVKYASQAAYADRIKSPCERRVKDGWEVGVGVRAAAGGAEVVEMEDEDFCVLVETMVCPGTFKEYPSTLGSYEKRKGDRSMEVMRVEREVVVVAAVTLVSRRFVETTDMPEGQLHGLLRGDVIPDP